MHTQSVLFGTGNSYERWGAKTWALRWAQTTTFRLVLLILCPLLNATACYTHTYVLKKQEPADHTIQRDFLIPYFAYGFIPHHSYASVDFCEAGEHMVAIAFHDATITSELLCFGSVFVYCPLAITVRCAVRK